MIVEDYPTQTEGLGICFKIIRKASSKTGKNFATQVMKNHARAMEVGKKSGFTAGSKNPKVARSTFPYVNNLYHTEKRLYLGKVITSKNNIFLS